MPSRIKRGLGDDHMAADLRGCACREKKSEQARAPRTEPLRTTQRESLLRVSLKKRHSGDEPVNRPQSGGHGAFVVHVQLESLQLVAALPGEVRQRLRSIRVAARRIAEPREHAMPAAGDLAGGPKTEAAAATGDENELGLSHGPASISPLDVRGNPCHCRTV